MTSSRHVVEAAFNSEFSIKGNSGNGSGPVDMPVSSMTSFNPEIFDKLTGASNNVGKFLIDHNDNDHKHLGKQLSTMEVMQQHVMPLDQIMECIEYLGIMFYKNINEPDSNSIQDPVEILRYLINDFDKKLFQETNDLLNHLDSKIAPHSKLFALLFGIKGRMANEENAEGSHSKQMREFIMQILEVEKYYSYENGVLPIDYQNVISECLWISDLPEDLSAWVDNQAQKPFEIAFKMPLFNKRHCAWISVFSAEKGRGVVRTFDITLFDAWEITTPLLFKEVSLEGLKSLINFASQEADTEKMSVEEYTVDVGADYFKNRLQELSRIFGLNILTEIPFRKQYSGNCFLYNFIFSHLASKNYQEISPLISYHVLSKLINTLLAALKAEVHARHASIV